MRLARPNGEVLLLLMAPLMRVRVGVRLMKRACLCFIKRASNELMREPTSDLERDDNRQINDSIGSKHVVPGQAGSSGTRRARATVMALHQTSSECDCVL